MMDDSLRVGDRVRWVSTKTGVEHVGAIVAIYPDLPRPYLVRPDGRQFRWVAWESEVERVPSKEDPRISSSQAGEYWS